jgi:RNA polymerase sigma-70 factor, ECF subfamily
MLANTNLASQMATAPLGLPAGFAETDEQELVSQAKNGLVDAIEQLVVRYERRIFRMAQNITCNHEDAEEVAQNVFVKAFRNLAAFRGDSRFYTWLVRITINEALMKIRARRHKEVSIDEPHDQDTVGFHELEDWGPNPEQRYSQKELREILATTISKLEPNYRTVFQLRDVEGFTTEETARALRLSSSAVKARLGRARLRLRNSLDVYFRASKRRNPRNSRAFAQRYSQVA